MAYRGAQSFYNVNPDISTFGKAMANGFSVSAVCGKKKYMELGSITKENEERVFLLSTTHGAEMCGLGAFIETTNFLKSEKVIQKNWKYGEKLIFEANKISKKLNLQEFSITYGDSIGNLNLNKLYNIHKKSKSIMTVAGTNPDSQYGHFIFNQNKRIIDFIQKPKLNSIINIGYFFCKKETIKYFEKYADLDLESGIMKKIAKNKKLSLYIHNGFWKSVDTLKDLKEINKLSLK